MTLFLFLYKPGFSQSERYLQLADSADYYIKTEQWQKAETAIIEALRKEPANFGNSLLFSNLGIVRENLDKDDEALEAFNLGISIAPNSTILLNNRSRLLIKHNRLEEALDDLNKSLLLDSLQEWSLQIRGLLLTSLGKLQEAESDYLKLLELYPENSIAYAGIGGIAEINGDFEKAIEYYKQGLEIKDDPDILSSLILLMIKKDNYNEASQLIREGIKKNPQYADFYVWRGYLNVLNYRYEEARADKKLAEAYGADPVLIESYIQLPRR